eukprot:TRINITY_DN100_c0_g1_i1.p1 TRINITY_DN100_c0_g1~~TRINITY_DN100_c0_g1_i1.p1  ORF type:complete len:168 (+),score=35.64 TRINITY_DN100_c0_g1_i1:221-724(+)
MLWEDQIEIAFGQMAVCMMWNSFGKYLFLKVLDHKYDGMPVSSVSPWDPQTKQEQKSPTFSELHLRPVFIHSPACSPLPTQIDLKEKYPYRRLLHWHAYWSHKKALELGNVTKADFESMTYFTSLSDEAGSEADQQVKFTQALTEVSKVKDWVQQSVTKQPINKDNI